MTTGRPNAVANRRLLWGVMLAIAIWGGVLALGTLLFGYDDAEGEVRLAPNPLRGLVVLTCVTAFLGGWACLLVRRGQSRQG